MTNRRPAALTFDTELWHEGTWMQPYITPELRRQDNFRESIEYLRTILKHYHQHATFFITGPVLATYPDVVATLAQDGHEVGSHGFTHTRLAELGQERFRQEMLIHTQALEKLLGHKPKGFRAPHFSLSEKTKWALPILAELGFKYDSSLFPLATPQYGVSGSPKTPYRISFETITATDPESPLLELPPAVASIGGATIPAAGGIYFRLMPASFFAHLVTRASSMTTPILYFHQHELRTDTPQIKGPAIKTFLKYLGVQQSARKFEYLCERFNFDSIERLFRI